MGFMTESSQTRAAAEQAKWQAALSQQLSGIALPELQMLMGGETTPGSLTSMLQATQGGAVKAPMDQAAYQSALGTLNRGYAQQGRGLSEMAAYQGLRSGEARRSPGAVSSEISGAATALERDRKAALANLKFTSAATSMADYNKLLQLMGQGTQTALGLSQGFSGAANAGIAGMSNWSNANTAQAAAGGASTILGALSIAGVL